MKRICVIDRSGSMSSCLNDTIGGFNTFVKNQKSLGGTMSLYLFSDKLSTVYKDMEISEVPNLDTTTYVPQGSTALLDALGEILHNESINSGDMVIIVTDGEENSSLNYSLYVVKKLIDKCTREGVHFMYLGANQDAFQEAGKLGIPKRNIMNYDIAETQGAFEDVSTCVRNRSTGDDSTPIR